MFQISLSRCATKSANSFGTADTSRISWPRNPKPRAMLSSAGRPNTARLSSRLPRRLDHARLQERGDRQDPRPGRQGQSDLRALGRRRFSVAAVLIHGAIGGQLTCVFVDHGLLRIAEGAKVVSLFKGHYNIPLVHVDADEQSPLGPGGPEPIPSRSAR